MNLFQKILNPTPPVESWKSRLSQFKYEERSSSSKENQLEVEQEADEHKINNSSKILENKQEQNQNQNQIQNSISDSIADTTSYNINNLPSQTELSHSHNFPVSFQEAPNNQRSESTAPNNLTFVEQSSNLETNPVHSQNQNTAPIRQRVFDLL